MSCVRVRNFVFESICLRVCMSQDRFVDALTRILHGVMNNRIVVSDGTLEGRGLEATVRHISIFSQQFIFFLHFHLDV